MANVTIFGALRNAASRQKAMQPVNDWRRGWRVIHEPYTGAWQKNDELKRGDLTCYPALYACLNRITQDIGKLPFALKQLGANGIWKEAENTAWSPVLKKPNGFQTAQQFRESWILSKLTDGNTFVLKVRDESNKVRQLFVLDPARVEPLVSEAGRVFYRLNYPSANNLLPAEYADGQIVVPASEMIHDRINPFHHPLLGVPPLCAAAIAAGKNIRILRNSSAFFENAANPGGLVSGPAGLDEGDADKLQEFFNSNFTGEKSGKIAVIGADLKFTPFAFKAADSQLVEQMRYSDEQICQPFGIPPFKIGIGAIPAGLGVDAINLLYHEDALSGHIEAMENLLDEALSLPTDWGIWLDTSPLFRMDEGAKAEVATKLVGGGVETPNEGRLRFNLPPLEGGDTVYMQQQDFPLDQVRKNKIVDAEQNPIPPANDDTAEQIEAANEEARQLRAELWQRKALDATREAIHA
jgi:HK97 family phage portal protein